MRREFLLTGTVIILLILSACTATQNQEPSDGGSPADESISSSSTTGQVVDDEGEGAASSEETSPDSAGDETGQSDVGAPAVERPAWQHLPLTNARTGETFTLADFEDKILFVEPMATWCSNCRRQLTNVREARQQLEDDNVVFIALSVETNIDDQDLADYAEREGFDWLFAVATPEMLQGLTADYGQVITNPPSTPHFILRTNGTSTGLVTGIESASEILSNISIALR